MSSKRSCTRNGEACAPIHRATTNLQTATAPTRSFTGLSFPALILLPPDEDKYAFKNAGLEMEFPTPFFAGINHAGKTRWGNIWIDPAFFTGDISAWMAKRGYNATFYSPEAWVN